MTNQIGSKKHLFPIWLSFDIFTEGQATRTTAEKLWKQTKLKPASLCLPPQHNHLSLMCADPGGQVRLYLFSGCLVSTSESPGILWITISQTWMWLQITWTSCRNADSCPMGLGRNQRSCMSNEAPGDAVATGPCMNLGEMRRWPHPVRGLHVKVQSIYVACEALGLACSLSWPDPVSSSKCK